MSEPNQMPPQQPAVAGDEPVEPGDERAAALRALRNLEASRERLERSAKLDAEQARGGLVRELLPVLDNLDRMIHVAEPDTRDAALLTGVRMVRTQLESVLHRFGAERVDALHERFDPNRHDAIHVVRVADPKLHGMIIDQAEPGYAFAGRLLRPAKVSVGQT